MTMLDAAPDQAVALDAYSRVVTAVARRLLPSVASLGITVAAQGGRRTAGGGSAVVLSGDGDLVTSAHVVASGNGGVLRSATAARSGSLSWGLIP